LARPAFEAGDDEPGIGALEPGLDAGDDALDPAPALRGIVELPEPPHLAAPGRRLFWQKAPLGPMPPTALLVRPEIAVEQLRAAAPTPLPAPGPTPLEEGGGPVPPITAGPTPSRQRRRFYGSVEVDMVRPVKAFEAILSAVVAELQRSKGTKVRLTLEIEADAEDGFSDADIGVVRDNARQLKFKPESTGFE
jgi:hypothetical protein